MSGGTWAHLDAIRTVSQPRTACYENVSSPRSCVRRVGSVCPRTAPETRTVVPNFQQLPIIRHSFSLKCKQCQWFTYGLILAKVLTVNGRKQHSGQERDSADDLQD